jgi:protein phosphatase
MRRASRLVVSDYLPEFAARSYAISAKGTQEQINQDGYLVADHFPAQSRTLLGASKHMPGVHDPGDALYIIADGFGEAQAGSRASGLAVEVIEESLRHSWGNLQRLPLQTKDRRILNALRIAFDRAAHVVRDEPDVGPLAGAAVTALAAHGGKLFLSQAGNNQAYLWRAGKLHRLNLQPEMTVADDRDETTWNENSVDSYPSMVGGVRTATQVKLRVVDLESNDYVLLCTKGLARHVRDCAIRSTISATPDPQRICDSLFAEAGKYPIREDLTMIAVRFALTHG